MQETKRYDLKYAELLKLLGLNASATYYDVLGISRDAETLEGVVRKFAKEWHPDAFSENKAALVCARMGKKFNPADTRRVYMEVFKTISGICDYLKDPNKRKKYDDLLASESKREAQRTEAPKKSGGKKGLGLGPEWREMMEDARKADEIWMEIRRPKTSATVPPKEEPSPQARYEEPVKTKAPPPRDFAAKQERKPGVRHNFRTHGTGILSGIAKAPSRVKAEIDRVKRAREKRLRHERTL